MTTCNEPGCVDGRTPHKGQDSWAFPSGVPCPRCSPAKAAVEAVCERCDGTRLVTLHFPATETSLEWDADDQPCPECLPESACCKAYLSPQGLCARCGHQSEPYTSPAPQSVEAVGEERLRNILAGYEDDLEANRHQEPQWHRHPREMISVCSELLTTRASLQEMRGEVERLTRERDEVLDKLLAKNQRIIDLVAVNKRLTAKKPRKCCMLDPGHEGRCDMGSGG